MAAPKFRAYGKLIAWLGVGSIIMPLFSGTFFGMKLADIIPMPDSIKALFFSDLKMFWFAIIFGLFQIVFARMLKAIFAFTKRRWDEGLTELGWSLIIGLGFMRIRRKPDRHGNIAAHRVTDTPVWRTRAGAVLQQAGKVFPAQTCERPRIPI